MTESSGGWTDPAPPPSHYRQVKAGSYEVIVFGRVIGRVAKCAPGQWAALTLDGLPAGPLRYYIRRDLACYALVMCPEGISVWGSAVLAAQDLDELASEVSDD